MPKRPPALDSATTISRLIPKPQHIAVTGEPVRFGSVSVTADDPGGQAVCSSADPAPDGTELAAELVAELVAGSGAGRGDDAVPLGVPELSLIVGTAPDGPAWRTARTLVPDVPAQLRAEGYVLAINGQAHAPVAVVAGSDPAGTSYGLRTLLALLDQEPDGTTRRLPRVVVHDWPELEWRGTIEGFYGPPWSHADRLAHLRFASRHKLNTYVYAPKDDPYHRKQWRDPYPADQLAGIGELAALARRCHIRFVFSISPGLSMVYSDPAELDLLLAKMEQVRQVGVRDFALLFDDIPPELTHQADIEAMGTEPGASARAHAAVCQQVLDRFLRPGGGGPLVMVPTDYAGTGSSPYREHLARDLPDDVLVWWTGSDIVVGEVTRSEIDAAADSYGHRLLLWDNFPVNDFDVSRLFLGPLTGRTSMLAGSALAGITANPMPQEAASQIALATVADWAWNPGGYDPALSHERALDSVDGASAIRMLVQTCSAWPPSAPQYPELSALIDAALNAPEERAAAVDSLRRIFATMVDSAPTSAPSSRLEREVAPWLKAQAVAGRAGLAALDVLTTPSQATIQAAKDALTEAEACEQNVLKSVVPPFVAETIKRAEA